MDDGTNQLVNCLIKPTVHLSTKLTYTLQMKHYEECITCVINLKSPTSKLVGAHVEVFNKPHTNHFRRVESKGMTPIMFNILVVLDIGLEALP